MGKKTGLVCLALGMLFLVGAAFSKWYAYPRLALAVIDRNTTDTPAVARGDNATYLNLHESPPEIVTGGELESVRKVVGQVDDSEQASDELGRKIAVYKTLSYTDVPGYNQSTDGPPLNGTLDRIAFDRNTAEQIDCCDTWTEFNGTKTKLTFKGLYLKFPMNTQQEAYTFWDTTLKTATPILFEGQTEIQGMTVYKFVQEIPPTDVDMETTGKQHLEVPGYLVGEPNQPTVKADRIYSNTRTIWAEPETGAIIDAQEAQLSTLDVGGVEKATITDVTLKYTDDTVTFNVNEWKDEASQLKLIRVWIPMYGGLAGLILLGLGVFFLIRGSRHREQQVDDDDRDHQEPMVTA